MHSAPRFLLVAILLTLLVTACVSSKVLVQPTRELRPSPTGQPSAQDMSSQPARSPVPAQLPTTPPAVVPTLPPTPSEAPAHVPTIALSPTAGDYVLVEERSIGAYTVRVFQPVFGMGMYKHATISKGGQSEIRVESVAKINDLPAEDVTGDGFPDVWFETYAGGSHCCYGTVIYNLGSVPVKVLDILESPFYYGTGTGIFQDLDGDDAYEFITRDPLKGIPCSGPSVKVILQYTPGQGYVGAGPRFAGAYADDIAAHTRRAEEEIDLSREGYKCGVSEVIADYLYAGQADLAWQELQRLYQGADLAQFRMQLAQVISEGRFFVPTATTWP